MSSSQILRVIVIGASGTLGAAIARKVAASDDLRLIGAISRRLAGCNLRDLVPAISYDLYLTPTLAETLRGQSAPDVVIDVSDPDAAVGHAEVAVRAGCHVVIGATLQDFTRYRNLDVYAREKGVGIVVASNLSASSTLMRVLARYATSAFTEASIEDRAGPHVPAPLRTSIDLAHCLARAGICATIHSTRDPAFVSEILLRLGGDGQELHVSARVHCVEPYADGALAAARRIGLFKGVHIGLDTILPVPALSY